MKRRGETMRETMRETLDVRRETRCHCISRLTSNVSRPTTNNNQPNDL